MYATLKVNLLTFWIQIISAKHFNFHRKNRIKLYGHNKRDSLKNLPSPFSPKITKFWKYAKHTKYSKIHKNTKNIENTQKSKILHDCYKRNDWIKWINWINDRKSPRALQSSLESFPWVFIGIFPALFAKSTSIPQEWYQMRQTKQKATYLNQLWPFDILLHLLNPSWAFCCRQHDLTQFLFATGLLQTLFFAFSLVLLALKCL